MNYLAYAYGFWIHRWSLQELPCPTGSALWIGRSGSDAQSMMTPPFITARRLWCWTLSCPPDFGDWVPIL